jgi:SOS-response transcriptional repressor LexA
MVACVARRKFTPADLDAARRLRSIWERKKEALGLTQEKVAYECGWRTQGAFNHLVTARVPLGVAATLKLAQVLQVAPEEIRPDIKQLLETVGAPPPTTAEASNVRSTGGRLQYLPLISWVQSGQWSETVDFMALGEPIRMVPVTKKVGPNSYVLRVEGDSMVNPGDGDSFPPGCLIVVDPDYEHRHKSYVIARLNGGEVTFKQLVIDGGQRYLKPLNPRYPLTVFTEDMTLCGVVRAMTMEFD